MATVIATLTATVEQLRNDQIQQKKETKETSEKAHLKITNLGTKVD